MYVLIVQGGTCQKKISLVALEIQAARSSDDVLRIRISERPLWNGIPFSKLPFPTTSANNQR